MGGSAGANPEVAETLKYIAEARGEQLVPCADSEAMVTRTYSPRRVVPRAGVRWHSVVRALIVGTALEHSGR